MQKRYDYSASTFDAQAHVDELNREIRDHCADKPLTDEAARELLMAKLLRRAGAAAFNGASNREGGPFGALLVDFKTEDGIPKVVGFGTNHVVPTNDPSAHAEMTAIRDASARLGKTDLSGLTLITSCECCPMCLSAATGCKVDQVYFAATREDAAKVGFSDEDQYRLMKAGGIEQHASKAADVQQAEAKLLGHDAVVEVRHNNHVYAYFGDYSSANPNDPTDLPVVQAIKKACADLARLRSEQTGQDERVFHLPEDTSIISRDMPHPMSLVTADWARIGRVRGEDPENPALDAKDKDTSRIQYINDRFETMQVASAQGKDAVDAQRVWDEIRQPSAMHKQDNLGRARTIAFEKWDAMVNNKEMPRY